ncbi:MAG: T9SS type A sorting domain-containing protein [Bacteroidota bacterium]
MKMIFDSPFAVNIMVAGTIIFINAVPINAQGPISPTGLIGQKEVILIWDEGNNSETNIINHQLARLITGHEGQPDLEQRLEFGDKNTEGDGSYGNRQLDVATGDFNGDGLSDYVVASMAGNKQVRLRIPELQDSTLSYTSSQTVLVGSNVDNGGDIHVITGNFDSDDPDEFVLAYKDMNHTLHIELYDTDGGLVPVLKAQVADEVLAGTHSPNGWGIDVNDLNNDLESEVIIGFRPEDPAQGVFVKVYALNGETFNPKTRKLIDNNILTDNSQTVTIAVTAGNFDRKGNNDIALAWGRIDSCDGTGCDDTFIYPLHIGDDEKTSEGDDLESITFSHSHRAQTSLSPNAVSPLNLKSGDLNGDGQDEIVLGGSKGAEVFVADTTFALISKNRAGNYSDDAGYAVDFLRVADIDGQAGDDVILLDHFFSNEPGGEQRFTLTVYGFSSRLNRDSVIARKSYFESISVGSGSNYRRHYSLAAGDFDGDNFRIGEGKRYVKTDVIQPLVILNAPPTHFDIVNGKVYDVNSCYNTNLSNCFHTATYYKSASESRMVNTQVYSNWGISAGLKLGASAYGIGATAHMKATYGEKFSRTRNNSTTVQISSQIAASGDDLIYATICDYEVWEYPVIAESNAIKGYIIALLPTITENRWFPSKERSAAGYIPKHEVGNILSYTPYNDLENPDLTESLRGSYLNGSTDLNESTDATFEVNINNTFSDESTRSSEIGLEVGASVGGYGIEVEGTANYEQGAISTHSTTVNDEIDIKVHFGSIDRSLGETNFNVTPYVYWASNGALVVDYAARAILPSQGGTATWWSSTYGTEQDPAFILPWRLDPEKGLALQDQERRRQTKSIELTPAEPSAGDTVTITALVSNFSLIETEDSVALSFYLGDPGKGGTIITGMNGESTVKTPGIIPAQEARWAKLEWKVPSGLPAFPRIYAVIDPENTMTEIHESNNVGWMVIGRSDFTSGVRENPLSDPRGSHSYYTKSYPNPFHGSFTIEYESSTASNVSLQVFDTRGSLVYDRGEEYQPAGTHSLEIPSGSFTPGLYYYRFSNGKISEMRKIVKQ